MISPLVECIPNFSEGKRPEVIEQIRDEIAAVPDVYVLNTHMDGDHNRSVITFVGNPAGVEEAAFRMIAKAAELIDMESHSGEHPRLGATDVVPFVPISEISMEDCIAMAHRLGERVGKELEIPVYFYEQAALRPERKRLEKVRKGEYEALKKEISKVPEREPDQGPKKVGKAGATIIGAREFLIAYNVYLTTDDESIADKIAKTVRHSSGGLRFVKALGMLVDGQAQVSMNLTNFKKTSLAFVVETIRREARRYGVQISHSELVGLIPQAALVDASVWYTQMDMFEPDQVLETRLYAALAEEDSGDFLDQLAAGTATPGGGAAAARSGAMGAALAAMVARLSRGKKKYEEIEEEMGQILEQAEKLRSELIIAAVEDADAFTDLMNAYRLPKKQADRKEQILQATLHAAAVPLQVCQKAAAVMELGIRAAEIGNLNAISDAASGVQLAQAALQCAALNVRINLMDLKGNPDADRMLSELVKLENSVPEQLDKLQLVIRKRSGLYGE